MVQKMAITFPIPSLKEIKDKNPGMYVNINPQRTGIGEVVPIFWTITYPPGLQRLIP